MKALPMFDRLMFVIARWFSAVCASFSALFILLLVLLLLEVGVFDMVNILTLGKPLYSPDDIREHFLPVFSGDKGSWLVMPYSFLLFAGVRMLPNRFARICIGLTAGAITLLLAPGTLDLAFRLIAAGHENSVSHLVKVFFVALIALVGFFSMTWAAFRQTPGTGPQNPVNLVTLV